jgi:hypothetical protein
MCDLGALRAFSSNNSLLHLLFCDIVVYYACVLIYIIMVIKMPKFRLVALDLFFNTGFYYLVKL